MIINQTIKDGFCVVNKTGAYFSLISAGGIVRVKLTKNGSSVLDSQMWVGMNIPQAIPFDEIEISGADGQIEFWAGDVSMNQGMISLNVAKAVRSSVKLAVGEQKLVGSDLTRTAVRLRSDKDVFIGGTGFYSSGWRLAANETLELPLAGIVSAYKPAAYLNYSAFDDFGDVDSFWELTGTHQSSYVSHDEIVRAQYDRQNKTLRLTQDSGVTWQTVLSGVYGYEVDNRTGTHYAFRKGAGGFAHFLKSDSGIEWSDLFVGYLEIPAGTDTGTSKNNFFICGDNIQYISNGCNFCCNIITGVAHAKRVVSPNGVVFNYGCFVDADLNTGYFGGWTADNEIFKTIDGGKTWKDTGLRCKYSSFKADPSGRHFIMIDNADGQVYLSENADNWVKCQGSSWLNKSSFCHIYQNIWVCNSSGYWLVANIENGAGVNTSIGVKGVSMASETVFFNPQSGMLYSTRKNEKVQKVGIQVVGDISAARIEVMELLS